MGTILHLTLATQLDLDADVFGVWVFWVRVGIVLHLTLATLTLATQVDLDADVFGLGLGGLGWA